MTTSYLSNLNHVVASERVVDDVANAFKTFVGTEFDIVRLGDHITQGEPELIDSEKFLVDEHRHSVTVWHFSFLRFRTGLRLELFPSSALG